MTPPPASCRSSSGLAVAVLFLVCLLVAASGCEEQIEGPQGPQGPPGPPGPGPVPAALASVSPARIFTGRTTVLLVTGDNTEFDDTWTVEIAPGALTARTLAVASPSALVVEVTVPATADPGRREVTASRENVGLVLEQGIELVPPIAVEVAGPVAQGAIIGFRLVMLDETTPIGPSPGFGTLPQGLLEPLPFSFRTSVPGATVPGRSGDPFVLEGLAVVRPDALPGEAAVLLDRNGDDLADDILPGALNVAEAKTRLLTLDDAVAGVVDAKTPARYSVELSAGQQGTVELTAVGEGLSPRTIAFGPGGDAESLVGLGGERVDFFAREAGTYAVVVFDADHTPGKAAGFTLSARAELAPPSVEVEPNDEPGQAQAQSLPVAMQGTLEGTSDVDLYAFTLAQAGRLELATAPGPEGQVVDTRIDVVGGTLPSGLPAGNDDAEAGRTPFSRLLTGVLDPGTYVVAVSLARGEPGPYTLLARPRPED